MEDFISFEIAKTLKEKGFPQKPDYFNYSNYYDWDGLRKIHSLTNESVWFDPKISIDNIYFAPTISQVLKWLRNEKKIHIGFGYSPRKKWRHVIMYMDDRFYNKPTVTVDGFLKIEQAALAGIKYVLDNLI